MNRINMSGDREMKKSVQALILFLLMLLLCSCVALAEGFLPLSVGDRGDEVLAIKKRLYALNYIRTDTLTRQYTEDTQQRIKRFQQFNGLPETGVVDEATYAVLFSENAIRAPWPTMQPVATPAPLTEPDWPERDEDGYLAGKGEYFYENNGEGRWAYLNENLQINITRREDSRLSLEWFETEILARNGEALRAIVTDRQNLSRGFRYPEEIAQEERFVLGFSDDFYANRITKKETVGVIIRNGDILWEKTNSKTGRHLPNLDMMAQFQDGSLQVYDCNEYSARELMEAGAVNVFSFGPWLIRDGEINETVYQNFKSIEPRQALGMIAPNHYFLLSIEGRNKYSEGTTLQRVAEIMQAHGVVQALNLDGGNTMALVFHGKMLNKLAVYNNEKFVRRMTSMIGIGCYGE